MSAIVVAGAGSRTGPIAVRFLFNTKTCPTNNHIRRTVLLVVLLLLMLLTISSTRPIRQRVAPTPHERVHGAVVTQQQIPTYKRTGTFCTMKRPLLCMTSFVTRSVLAPAKCAVTITAVVSFCVFAFWRSRRRPSSVWARHLLLLVFKIINNR